MQNPRWWDLAAITVALVVAGVAAVDPPYGTNAWGDWSSVAAFLLLYFGYARRFLARPDARNGYIIAALFGVIVAAGVSFDPSFSIIQVFVFPFIWVTAVTMRGAIVGNLFIGAGIVIGHTLHNGPGGVLPGIAVAVLSVGFSLALGFWITRIEETGAERGRLLAELQAAQGELAALHRDAGVTSERERLAREIHDTIAQSLTGLVMVAERAGGELAGGRTDAAGASLALIESMARDALTEARTLVAAMTPVRVESTLAEALARLAARFERETGVVVTSHVAADVAARLTDRELEVVLLRCAQEGLANVRKHARASTASVGVAMQAAEVVLTVTDDGVGVEGLEPHADAGFGVPGMRDRVALVGGAVELGRAPGGGAVLRIAVPARGRPPGSDAAGRQIGTIGSAASATSTGETASAAPAASTASPSPAACAMSTASLAKTEPAERTPPTERTQPTEPPASAAPIAPTAPAEPAVPGAAAARPATEGSTA